MKYLEGADTMIGKNIQNLREQHGWTQAMLAKSICVTRQALTNYENEKREPDINILIQLANRLDTTIDDLVGRK